MEKPKSEFLIYMLHNPTSQRVYVGKSSTGLYRPAEHSSPSALKRYAKLPRSKWIKSLHKRKEEAKILVLEELAGPDLLNEAECFYIAYFRSIGMKLLNVTDGGEGIVGYRHTEQAKKQMSEVRKELAKQNPERFREMTLTYWADKNARQQQSKRLKENNPNNKPGVIEKIAKSNLGQKRTPEQIENIRRAAEQRWLMPGYRENQVKKQCATHRSTEARAEASRKTILSWQDPDYRTKNLQARGAVLRTTAKLEDTKREEVRESIRTYRYRGVKTKKAPPP